MGSVQFSARNTIEEQSYDALRLTAPFIEKLQLTYQRHNFQPIVDDLGLASFLHSSLALNGVRSQINSAHIAIKDLHDKSTIAFNLLEIQSAIIFLGDGITWNDRLNLLFHLFKSNGSSQINYNDVILCCQTVAFSLARLLWHQDELLDKIEIFSLSEQIADHLYTTTGKDLEEGIDKDAFIDWALERFRESRKATSMENLILILRSPFE